MQAVSPSLRARGMKTRETPSQQPLHGISGGSEFTVAEGWLLFGKEGGNGGGVDHGGDRNSSLPVYWEVLK